MKTRNYKLDALKMFLIICVILGHVPLLNGFINIGLPEKYDVLTHTIVRGIYAFHMPLFVLLSGYFSKKKTMYEQLVSSLKLLKLFVAFQILDIVIQSFIYGNTPSFYRFFHPCFALWYLLCLFYWRILLAIIPKVWNSKWIVAASVAISLAIGFMPIQGEMGLHRFFSFMPYFMIGHYYGRNIMQHIDNKYATNYPPTHVKKFIHSLC